MLKEKIEKRIGLNYPKEYDGIFELPVRKNKKYYQVWNGKRWYKIYLTPAQSAGK